MLNHIHGYLVVHSQNCSIMRVRIQTTGGPVAESREEEGGKPEGKAIHTGDGAGRFVQQWLPHSCDDHDI